MKEEGQRLKAVGSSPSFTFAKGIACQEMKGDYMSKLFLDLDDSKCTSLDEAEKKTKAMIEWAKWDVAAALGLR